LAVGFWLWAVSPVRELPARFVRAATRGRALSAVSSLRLVDGAVIAYVVLNVVAYWFSTDRHQSLIGERLQHQGLLSLLLYVGFYALARVAFEQPRRVLWLLSAVAAGSAAVAAYALVQKAGRDPIWHGFLPMGRVFSTIGQPNALGAYLVVAVAAAVTLVLAAPRVVKLGAVALIPALLAALTYSLSRGGQIALVAIVPPLLWAAVRRGEHRTWMGRAAVAAAVAIGLTVAFTPAARDVITTSWERALTARQVNGDVSIRNHLDQWRVAAQIIEEHPFVGTGPETFPDQFPSYSRAVLPAERVAFFDQFRVETPHNLFLTIAQGAGLPALLAFVVLLVAAGDLMRRAAGTTSDRRARVLILGLLAALIGHVVANLFMSAEITGTWLFWTLLGAGVAAAGPSERALKGRAAAVRPIALTWLVVRSEESLRVDNAWSAVTARETRALASR
jgi:O-antigen ligase